MRHVGLAAVILGALAAAGAGDVQAQDACPHDPDLGQIAVPPAPCFDVTAVFERPVRRYGHNVLGDGQEYATMAVTFGRAVIRVNQPISQIFEDLAPRVVELDGDPGPEILVVEANVAGGAILAVYDTDDTRSEPRVTRQAATRPIGTRFRWLAPVGVADFDGDGRIDIAYVETPHLGKTLRFVTMDGAALSEIAAAEGFTNHRIGEAWFESGVRDCGDGPEAILADATWSNVVAARLEGGAVVSRVLSAYAGRDSIQAALVCP